MEKQEAIDLMKSSKSEDEWNTNCDTIKIVFNGYPDWWYMEIINSGLLAKVKMNW